MAGHARDSEDARTEGQVGTESAIADINQADEMGYTLLHHAADSGDPIVIRRLLEMGANKHLRTKDSSTHLGFAPVDLAKMHLQDCIQRYKNVKKNKHLPPEVKEENLQMNDGLINVAQEALKLLESKQ